MTADYLKRHAQARSNPSTAFERALVGLINGLALYPVAHAHAYSSPLADDGVIGPAWLDALRAVVDMLNGELGRLDGGLLWTELNKLARSAGFEKGLDE